MTTIFDTPLLPTEEVSEALQLPIATLANMRGRGTGPRYIKLPNRKVRYLLTDVQAWVLGGTSDAAEVL